MATIDELKWSTLTPAVNEMKSPNQFVKRLLFGNHRAVSTEDIEVSVISRGREIAPFVRKNGEALMVGGHAHNFQTIAAPNIRIKRPFTPSELLFGRQPGTVIFIPNAAVQISAVQQHIARDLQGMGDLITNSEEYLCCLALRMAIAYSVSPEENFQITYPRSADNNVTLTTFWDDADPSLPTPEIDFLTAKRLISNGVGLGTTDVLLGAEASIAFLKLAKLSGLLDVRNVDAGSVTFVEQFSEDGAIFLGRFCGINVWEYSRTVLVDAVETSLIRPKYAEFVTRSPAAEHVLYYGAIPDFDAMEGRLFQGERFSKSWRVKDPSAQMALVHSRPLPVPRRPDSTVSMKVVSG